MSHEKKQNKIAKSAKKLAKKKFTFSLLGILIFVALVGVFSLFVWPKIKNRPGPQVVDTVSTLEKVVKKSSLSTYQVVYNGVSVVGEDSEKPDYYVSYKATVKAEYDFSKIVIDKDDENHIINVTLPKVRLSPTVSIQGLDYIILNNKTNLDTISVEAYKHCINDVTEEADAQKAIKEYAFENAKKLISGLLTPFVSQLEEKYIIEFHREDAK